MKISAGCSWFEFDNRASVWLFNQDHISKKGREFIKPSRSFDWIFLFNCFPVLRFGSSRLSVEMQLLLLDRSLNLTLRYGFNPREEVKGTVTGSWPWVERSCCQGGSCRRDAAFMCKLRFISFILFFFCEKISYCWKFMFKNTINTLSVCLH